MALALKERLFLGTVFSFAFFIILFHSWQTLFVLFSIAWSASEKQERVLLELEFSLIYPSSSTWPRRYGIM
jgi:hypothetical protein